MILLVLRKLNHLPHCLPSKACSKVLEMGCLLPNSVNEGRKDSVAKLSGLAGRIFAKGEFKRLLSLRYSGPEIFRIAPPLIT